MTAMQKKDMKTARGIFMVRFVVRKGWEALNYQGKGGFSQNT